MPDRIQITHTHAQPMTTPRTGLTSDDIPPGPFSEDDLRRGWNQQADEHNQWESLDSCEQLAWAQARAIAADRARAALKAEPEGEGPSEKDLYDLAEEFNGDPVPAMRRALEVWGDPPASEAPAEALAARPLLERVAQLGDVLGRQTVAQVRQLSEQADAWLRSNPPGQPVAIEPRGCPIPGACSCVGPTPPAPEDLATDQPMAANLIALLIKECGLHSPGSSTRDLLQRAAAMLVNYGLPARPATPPAPEPGPTFQDAIKLAQGCHDYSGGHSGAEGEAWHGAIGMVVDVLKRAAIGPWDSQTRAVYGVGVEAQAGEVEA